jgi:hypothetical protein
MRNTSHITCAESKDYISGGYAGKNHSMELYLNFGKEDCHVINILEYFIFKACKNLSIYHKTMYIFKNYLYIQNLISSKFKHLRRHHTKLSIIQIFHSLQKLYIFIVDM